MAMADVAKQMAEQRETKSIEQNHRFCDDAS